MRDEKAKANGMGRKNMWWVKLALIPFFSPFFFFFFFFGTPSVIMVTVKLPPREVIGSRSTG